MRRIQFGVLLTAEEKAQIDEAAKARKMSRGEFMREAALAAAREASAVGQIRKLHRDLVALIDAGQGDDDAAEAVRDRMEPLWHAMTAAEQEEHRRWIVATDAALAAARVVKP